MSTEIDDWAYITHEVQEKPEGGTYFAYDRATDQVVGRLSYFYLMEDHSVIQFKHVKVEEPFRRRKVATALLRHLNNCNPDARINPGTRNLSGNIFMDHILATEAEKVASNGVLNVPLSTMRHPSFSGLKHG